MSTKTETEDARTQRVLDEVMARRKEQIDGHGYTREHDAWHSPQDFITISNRQFTKPLTMEGRPGWYSRETFIDAIAVLVAGVEMMDYREEVRDAPRGDE